jgi:DNA-binding MarR family transcriptional regulator
VTYGQIRALPAQLMTRAHRLVVEGQLTLKEYGLLSHMLFKERAQGRDRCEVSYGTLARKLHVGRAFLSAAITKLEDLGLLARVRSWHWLTVLGRKVKRQATNLYIFPAPTAEFCGKTVLREDSKTSIPALAKPSPLDTALALLAARAGFRHGR